MTTTTGAKLQDSPLVAIVAALAGAVLIVVALLYLVEPADSLPSFMPGYDGASGRHHIKHALATLLLGLGALVLAWFQSGARPSKPGEQ